MSFSLGNKIQMTVEGASHSEYIEVRIEGLPKGFKVDEGRILEFLRRRQGGGSFYTTPRKEADEPVVVSGMENSIITGNELVVRFMNSNVRKTDYSNLKVIPRPSHADYVAYVKYEGKMDMSGGGFFSGRMTLPLCYVGAICKQILEEKGINIAAHISSIGGIGDERYSFVTDNIEPYSDSELPVLSKECGDKMIELLKEVAADEDSVGGSVECKVTGIPAGIGDPIYDSLESMISYGMFGIPAIKGIEFGEGFKVLSDRGSTSNDQFCIKDGKIRCVTNNSGGIQGGISNGMPIIFNVAIKPTPSIGKQQQSVDIETMEEVPLVIKGRHDACIVPRVVPCVEAMCALTLLNACL